MGKHDSEFPQTREISYVAVTMAARIGQRRQHQEIWNHESGKGRQLNRKVGILPLKEKQTRLSQLTTRSGF